MMAEVMERKNVGGRPSKYDEKIEHESFSESLTRGKIGADANIAKSLYHRAKGYSHKEIITATFQGKITDTMEVTKHYPPDTPAATLWLKNRQPKLWREKQELELTGPGGGPLQIQSIASMSEQDLRAILEIYERAALPEVVDITPGDE